MRVVGRFKVSKLQYANANEQKKYRDGSEHIYRYAHTYAHTN